MSDPTLKPMEPELHRLLLELLIQWPGAAHDREGLLGAMGGAEEFGQLVLILMSIADGMTTLTPASDAGVPLAASTQATCPGPTVVDDRARSRSSGCVSVLD